MIHKQNEVIMYMDIAKRIAQESKAVRMKAGAILVKDEQIISMGWNGTARGRDNCCEYVDPETNLLRTKAEVLHAEQNIIAKMAASTNSGKDATLFVTHGTCIDCAKILAKMGISQVYFEKIYRDMEGLDYLYERGVEINHFWHNMKHQYRDWFTGKIIPWKKLNTDSGPPSHFFEHQKYIAKCARHHPNEKITPNQND